ncbi:PucR family transcriptional regulator [Pseudonocardia sp.]|uniref:PucR family transcriptional regulator n=1 Tax=Pseudonocardia sp. TaxID=60912 RepID=UPI003D12BEFE
MDIDHVDDLFDVADAVARIVGGPVVIEDLDFRVLAYSTVAGQPNDEARRSAILHRRTPDRWLRWMEESGVRAKLLSSEEIVQLEFPWATFLPRYIQPIRAADTLVGYLWVMQGDVDLAPDFARLAKDFAAALAPELARRSRALTENPGGQVLRQYLGGGLAPSRFAEIMGVAEDSAVAVVAIEVEAATPEAVVLRSRAMRILAMHMQVHGPPSLVGNVDQQLYLLQTMPNRGHVLDLDSLLRQVVAHLERSLRTRVLAAAGGLHQGLDNAGASRQEADLALMALKSEPGGDTIGRFSAMRYRIVLHQLRAHLRANPHLVRGVTDQLADHDRRHGTEYVSTLDAYLRSFGDIREAAARLHIHPNSLRYRVRRLSELGGLDLEDPDVRLVLQLVLLAEGSPGPIG